ncbi:hypothetical protein DXD83_08635 [Ruminococcus bromii]|nr:hypothetical protein DXD86_00645 [Ruminococcus bromii]RGI81073.1 hypothetical protein DXD83_08635 [Ruminococcus bromii]
MVFGGIADSLDGCRLLLAVKSEVIHRHPDKQRQCKHSDEKSTVAEGGEGQRDPGRPQHQQSVDLAAVPDRRLGVMGLLPAPPAKTAPSPTSAFLDPVPA